MRCARSSLEGPSRSSRSAGLARAARARAAGQAVGANRGWQVRRGTALDFSISVPILLNGSFNPSRLPSAPRLAPVRSPSPSGVWPAPLCALRRGAGVRGASRVCGVLRCPRPAAPCDNDICARSGRSHTHVSGRSGEAKHIRHMARVRTCPGQSALGPDAQGSLGHARCASLTAVPRGATQSSVTRWRTRQPWRARRRPRRHPSR